MANETLIDKDQLNIPSNLDDLKLYGVNTEENPNTDGQVNASLLAQALGGQTGNIANSHYGDLPNVAFTETDDPQPLYDALNALPLQLVPHGKTYTFSTVRITATSATSFIADKRFYRFRTALTNGADAQGSYFGVGSGITLNASNMKFRRFEQSIITAENGVISNTGAFNLGNIGTTSVSDAVNNSPETYTESNGVIIIETRDENGDPDQFYIYNGSESVIGNGGAAVTDDDFTLVDPENSVPAASDIISLITKTSQLENDGDNGNQPFITVSDLPINTQNSVSNIESLKELAEPNALAIYVEGFYSSNDGGGGLFIWDPTSEDTEVDGIVVKLTSETIGRYKRQITNGIVDIRYTGCKCDNTGATYNGTATDDRAQFLKAAQYAIDNNLTLFAPSDLNIYLSGDIDLSGLRNVDLKAKIVGDGSSEFILGSVSSSALPTNYYVEEVRDIVIKFQGLKNASINVRYANDVTLYADADVTDINSLAYNSFYFGFVRNLLITNNENAVDTLNGWINENKFFLNRIFTITMSGNYPHNHNIFYGGSVEGANSFIDIQIGNGNHFYDLRLEGDASITFGENTRSNYVEKSYSDNDRVFLNKDVATTVTDLGVNNMVCTQTDKLLTETLLTDLNAFSKNYDLDDLVRKGGQLEINGGFDEVYKSEIIPLNQALGFLMSSDLSAFRMRVYCYDVNKATITTDPEMVNTGALSWDSANSRYGATANGSEAKAAIFTDDVVKFIQLEVSTGGGENGSLFDSLKVSLVHQFPIDVPSNSPTRLESAILPTSSAYPVGTKVYNTALTAGGFEGWIYVGSAWKTFGTIEA